MNFTTIPMFSVLRSSMSWLEQRQKLLAQNVANASMPGYKAKDLEDLDFSSALAAVDGGTGGHRSHSGHADGGGQSNRSGRTSGGIRISESHGSETSPDGNSVVLEEQMMKVAETQLQFEAAASLYQKGLNLIRIASRSR
jgi:flagellar basal-body rod protein FlgB